MFEVVASSLSPVPDRHVNNRVVQTGAILVATALTTSYVASNHVLCGAAERISLAFTYVHGTATSVEYYVEWSSDGSTWFRSINAATSGATNTLTQNANTISVSGSIKWEDTFNSQDMYVRISYKSTGAADGTLACTAVLLGL